MFRAATSKILSNAAVRSSLRHEGKRQFSISSNQTSNNMSGKVVVGVGALAFGSIFAYNEVRAASGSTPDFKSIRADIAALLDDENAKNPSVDGASNG